jgi:Holliday junction resolvase RusA-like endonuclease
MNFDIFINGHPKGQPRARAYARKMGAKFVARMYDSDTADAWKAQVRASVLTLANALALQAIGGAFEVTMLFRFERPKSHYTTSGALGKSRGQEHLQKPDADNLAKLVLDVITRLQSCWKDDDQVVRLVIEKRWAPAFKLPGCHLGVKSL